jgi:xanthine dehydrogenase large subunit
MFVIEAAIAKAAEALGIDKAIIQKKNLNNTGDEFPYGQLAESEANECWNKAEELYEANTIHSDVVAFNATNILYKKGIAYMPVCFGISFTNTMMNQARALVHVYADGSISVATGAIEMGQGVNTKMLQVAAQVFSVSPSKIKIQTTSTHKIANTSPSAASATADLNGKAVLMACNAVADRLKNMLADELSIDANTIVLKDEFAYINEVKTEWTWERLVVTAFMKRINLSEHSHYATPIINFDKTKEKGHPFAYHVYGTSITIVTVDCLRGTHEIDAVKIVHDFGTSMNAAIDKGQIEGGLVQGIGWMTMEELIYDKDGRLRSNALSTYKIPDIYSVPKVIDIHFLQTENNNLAIFKSKAVGEPPLMYGIGTYFALRDAIKAFNPSAEIPFSAPMTPEKTLMALYNKNQKAGKTQNEKATTSLEVN